MKKIVGTAETYFDTIRRRGLCPDCGAYKPLADLKKKYCYKCGLKRRTNQGKYLTVKDRKT